MPHGARRRMVRTRFHMKTGPRPAGSSACKPAQTLGRGAAADIDPRFRGFEMWGSGGTGGLYNVQNSTPNAVLGRAESRWPEQARPDNPSFGGMAILLRELLDGTTISKWNWLTESTNTVMSPPGSLEQRPSLIPPPGDILATGAKRSSGARRLTMRFVSTQPRFPPRTASIRRCTIGNTASPSRGRMSGTTSRRTRAFSSATKCRRRRHRTS